MPHIDRCGADALMPLDAARRDRQGPVSETLPTGKALPPVTAGMAGRSPDIPRPQHPLKDGCRDRPGSITLAVPEKPRNTGNSVCVQRALSLCRTALARTLLDPDLAMDSRCRDPVARNLHVPCRRNLNRRTFDGDFHGSYHQYEHRFHPVGARLGGEPRQHGDCDAAAVLGQAHQLCLGRRLRSCGRQPDAQPDRRPQHGDPECQ